MQIYIALIALIGVAASAYGFTVQPVVVNYFPDDATLARNANKVYFVGTDEQGVSAALFILSRRHRKYVAPAHSIVALP
jgi:hypothetical protein